MWLNRYWPEVAERFKRVMANRMMILLGMVGDSLPPILMYFVWSNAYDQGTIFGGLDRRSLLTYLFVAHFCRVFTFMELEHMYAHQIRSGDLARNLTLPQSLVWKEFFSALGQIFAWAVLVGVPLMLAGVLFFGVALPPVNALIPLAVSLLLAMAIAFGLSFLVGTIAFWTEGSIWGVATAKRLLMTFASGAVVPLSVLPDWMRHIAEGLPFQAGVHIPTSIYLGQIQGMALWGALAVQASWAASLLIVAHLFLRYSLRNATLPGG